MYKNIPPLIFKKIKNKSGGLSVQRAKPGIAPSLFYLYYIVDSSKTEIFQFIFFIALKCLVYINLLVSESFLRML